MYCRKDTFVGEVVHPSFFELGHVPNCSSLFLRTSFTCCFSPLSVDAFAFATFTSLRPLSANVETYHCARVEGRKQRDGQRMLMGGHRTCALRTDRGVCKKRLGSGIDQTAGQFKATMFAKFKELTPSEAMDKTYCGRTPKSFWSKLDEVDTDIQKFRDILQHVEACNVTVVTEDEIFSMSIAVHRGKA